jgi:hypothetical protein
MTRIVNGGSRNTVAPFLLQRRPTPAKRSNLPRDAIVGAPTSAFHSYRQIMAANEYELRHGNTRDAHRH